MIDPVLRVQMLGGFSLHLDEELIGPIPSGPASLLAHLIVNRERAQTRDLLAGTFWPDRDDSGARKALTNALYAINAQTRKHDGLELFVKTTESVRFAPPCDVVVDVETFTQQLDDFERRYRTEVRNVHLSELGGIVEAHRGEFLSGYYDDWITEHRESVRARHESALGRLVRFYTAEGDYETALRYILELVRESPSAEGWQREVLRLYAMNGQPSAAERHYAAYEKMLAEDEGLEPPAETKRLIASITADAASPPVTIEPVDEDGHAPLIGRQVERAALLGRVIELANGVGGGVVLLEGEPGIGKSRLVEELVRGAQWRGLQVCLGRHTETSPMSPYDGLRQALAPVARGLKGERLAESVRGVWLQQASSVIPELGELVDLADSPALHPTEEPWRTTEALVNIVLAQGKPRPTVLVLEDVHLCDEDTIAVLARLGDRLLDSGVLVCLTYQLHEAQQSKLVWNGLSELEAKPGSTRLVVPPLTEAEVRGLITSELGPGRLSETVLGQIISSTAGNPNLVLELLRSPAETFDEQLLDVVDATAPSRLEDRVLPRLTDIVTRRVDSAPAAVRAVLESLSAIGNPVSISAAAQIVGFDRLDVVDALQMAVEAGFLVESERGIEFAQDQTRRAVYAGIEPDDRKRLHGRIADSLVVTASDFAPEQLAHHAWLAGQWHRAHDYHASAASLAREVNAYKTAAEHYDLADRAAQSAGLADGPRLAELLEYEVVLDVLGRRDNQRRILDRLRVLEGLVLADELEVRRRHAWHLANTDRWAEAADLALGAVPIAKDAGFGEGNLLTLVGTARHWSGDLNGAVDALSDAIAAFEARDESPVEPQLRLGRAYHELYQLELAQHHLEEAHKRAKRLNDVRNQVEATGHLAAMLGDEGQVSEAEAYHKDAIALSQEIGYRHGEANNLVNLGVLHMDEGRSGKALPLLEQARDAYESLGNGRGVAFTKANAAQIYHLVVGDDVLASRFAEEASIYFRGVADARSEAESVGILASVDRRHGRRRRAVRRLQHGLERAGSGDDRAVEARVRLVLARVQLDLGRPVEALEEIERADQIRLRFSIERLTAPTLALRARSLVAMGEVKAGAELTEKAIMANHPGAEWAHLSAWWSAEALAAAGRHGPASAQVAFAHELVSKQLDALDELSVKRSWLDVPEHRAISEARERYFVESRELALPTLTSPTGRPLETEEYVDIVWTVSHPDDRQIANKGARRRHRLLRLTREASDQGAVARISDLAEVTGVSVRTIKRDLSQLRSEGHNITTRRGPGKNFNKLA